MPRYPIEHDAAHKETIADHFPLTAAEIAELLVAAKTARHHPDPRLSSQTVASIQERLIQGIAGMECPRPASGPVARRMRMLDAFYVRWVRAIGPDEPISAWIVRQFDVLINGGTPCATDAPEVIACLRQLGASAC